MLGSGLDSLRLERLELVFLRERLSRSIILDCLDLKKSSVTSLNKIFLSSLNLRLDLKTLVSTLGS